MRDAHGRLANLSQTSSLKAASGYAESDARARPLL